MKQFRINYKFLGKWVIGDWHKVKIRTVREFECISFAMNSLTNNNTENCIEDWYIEFN